MVRKVKGSKVLHKIGMRDADPAKPTKDYDYKGMKITLYKNGDRWVWQLEGKSGTGYGRGEYSDKEGAKFDAEFEADKIMKGSRYKKIENKDSDPRGYKVSDQIIKGFLIYKSGKGPATFFAKNENGKEFEGTMEQIKRQIDDYWVKQDEEVMKQKMRDALEGQSFSSLEAWQQYAKKHLYKIERSGGNWFAYKTAGGRPVGQFDVDKQRGTLEIYKDSKTKDDLHSEAKPWAKKVLLAMRDIYKSSGDDNIYDLFNDAMGRVSPPSSLKAIIRIYILSGANFGYSEGVIFKGASAGYLDSKTKDTKDASQAYLNGYAAARGAYGKHTNPIKNDPAKAAEWDKGWEDGKADKEELSAKGSGQEYIEHGSHFKDAKPKHPRWHIKDDKLFKLRAAIKKAKTKMKDSVGNYTFLQSMAEKFLGRRLDFMELERVAAKNLRDYDAAKKYFEEMKKGNKDTYTKGSADKKANDGKKEEGVPVWPPVIVERDLKKIQKEMLRAAEKEEDRQRYNSLYRGNRPKETNDFWSEEYKEYEIIVKEFGRATFEFTIQKNGKDVYKGVEISPLSARIAARRWIDQNQVFKDKYTGDPLTKKGNKILTKMRERYGKKKGESVFYASKNKGTITGVDGKTKDVSAKEIRRQIDELKRRANDKTLSKQQREYYKEKLQTAESLFAAYNPVWKSKGQYDSKTKDNVIFMKAVLQTKEGKKLITKPVVANSIEEAKQKMRNAIEGEIKNGHLLQGEIVSITSDTKGTITGVDGKVKDSEVIKEFQGGQIKKNDQGKFEIWFNERNEPQSTYSSLRDAEKMADFFSGKRRGSAGRLRKGLGLDKKTKDEVVQMQCNECGKRFKKNITSSTVEVKCPACGGYDTEVDEPRSKVIKR